MAFFFANGERGHSLHSRSTLANARGGHSLRSWSMSLRSEELAEGERGRSLAPAKEKKGIESLKFQINFLEVQMLNP